jgi:hypothetical protein
MKGLTGKFFIVFSFLFLSFNFSNAESKDDSTFFSNNNIHYILNQHFEGHWFLGYRYSDLSEGKTNQFTLKRSYITFKHKFNKRLDVRFTQDITIDREGDDAGNIETRLKYCYLNVNLDDFSFITDPYIEGGLVHRPWLDFEQKINHYRIQGTMFLERIGLINSADFGFTIGGLFGGKINEEYRKQVNSKYPGRYGSFAIGIYNGAGYHALEKNQNKTFEGRLTVRPLPEVIPGMQLSYNVVFGKGNTELNPDFTINSGMISYNSRLLVLTAQYYSGYGNSKGSYADSFGNAYSNEGYSFFGEFRIPKTKLAVFSRVDRFISEHNELNSNRLIGGISYYFYKNSKFIIDMDYYDPETAGIPDQKLYEAVIEIKF